MRKMLGLAAAAFLALGVSAASAEEVKGAVANIDLAKGTFEVAGKRFITSEVNTAGVKLSELKEGEEVRVMFGGTAPSDEGGDVINAEVIEKVE